MNSNPHNRIDPGSAPTAAEETLRLIARLPAPAGLEGRMQAALRVAPRRGRVLAWPTGNRSIAVFQSNWMRSAAAAVIVFVVAGGGWGVYMRVQQHQPGKVVTMPARVPGASGFSDAGAVRTPQTLPGPTVTQPAKAAPAPPKTRKKPAARSGFAAKGRIAPPEAPAAQPPATK
jgi:hypothetical protein